MNDMYPGLSQIAPNFTIVTIGRMKFWFSYSTLIAFTPPDERSYVRKNIWSKTTEKHLSYVNKDKDTRLDEPEFQLALNQALSSYFGEPVGVEKG